jgi:transcriptional regulator
MYVPSFNAEQKPEVLHAFMRRYSFATMVASHAGEMTASHLPVLLDAERGAKGTIQSHMARQNPQWKLLELTDEVLVIFQGPHAYISPSWYVDPLRVPTWNYAAVHAYGKPRLLDDSAVDLLLEKTVAEYEAEMPQPWSMEKLPTEFVKAKQKGVVGFEIEITRLEGKWKMSQNLPREDREGVINALGMSGDTSAIEVAELMAAIDKPT